MWFTIGDALLFLNRFDKAITFFEEVIKLDGDQIVTLDRLMICYDYKCNPQKTLEYCDRIISLLIILNKDRDLLFSYYLIKFEILVFQQNEKSAREVITKSQELARANRKRNVL